MPRHRVKKKLLFADERQDFVNVTAKKRRKTALAAATAVDQGETIQTESAKCDLPGLEKLFEILEENIVWGFLNPEQETQRTALDAEHNVLAVFGPPTTGKTASVTKLCNDHGIGFVTADCQDLLEIGKPAAHDVRKLFDNAKNEAKTSENALGAAVILMRSFNRLLDFSDSRSAASVLRAKVSEQIKLLKPLDRVKVVLECQKLNSRDRSNLAELGVNKFVEFQLPDWKMTKCLLEAWLHKGSYTEQCLSKLYEAMVPRFRSPPLNAPTIREVSELLRSQSQPGIFLKLNQCTDCVIAVHKKHTQRKWAESKRMARKKSPERHRQQDRDRKRKGYEQNAEGQRDRKQKQYGQNPERQKERVQKEYEQNPEKQRERKQKEYEQNPERQKERVQKEYEQNPEKQRERKQKEYEQNLEKHRERKQKEYEQNPERQKERVQKEYEQNPEKQRERKQKEYEQNLEKHRERKQKEYEQNPERQKERVQKEYEQNPEKQRERKQKEYEQNLEKHRERKQKEYEQNPERQKERVQKEYEQNPEKQRERKQKEYEQNLEKHRERKQKEYEQNPERQKERVQKEYEQNPEKQRERKQKEYEQNPEKQRETRRLHHRKDPAKKRKQNKDYYEKKTTPLELKHVQAYAKHPSPQKRRSSMYYELHRDVKRQRMKEWSQQHARYLELQKKVAAAKQRMANHVYSTAEILKQRRQFAREHVRINNLGWYMSENEREESKTAAWRTYVTNRLYRRFVKDCHFRKEECRQTLTAIRRKVAEALNLKRAVVANMYIGIKRLAELQQGAQKAIAGKDRSVHEEILRGTYGGAQVHVKSQEAYRDRDAAKNYTDIDKLLVELGYAADENEKAEDAQNGAAPQAPRAEGGVESAPPSAPGSPIHMDDAPSPGAAHIPFESPPSSPPNPNPTQPPSPSAPNPARGPASTKTAEEQESAPILARACDTDCDIPVRWARRIHAALATIADPDLQIMELLGRMIKFESCTGCYVGHYDECAHSTKCTDQLKFMRKMSPHYRRLRTVQRLFYRVRHDAIWIMKLDELFARGTYEEIVTHIDTAPVTPPDDESGKEKPVKRSELNENELLKKYSALKTAFEKAKESVADDHCQSCHLLFESKHLTHFGTQKLRTDGQPDRRSTKAWEKTQARLNDENSKLNDLLNAEGKTADDLPIRVCHTCEGHLQKNEIPPLSKLNKMGLDAVPPEIGCLNETEIRMCQLATMFRSTFKLRPLSRKAPDSSCVTAYKGNAIHLPMPLQANVNYLERTLPARDHVYIVVDAPPTAKNVIWRGMVNLQRLNEALHWLKKENPLYENIKIDTAAFGEMPDEELPIVMGEDTVPSTDDEEDTGTDDPMGAPNLSQLFGDVEVEYELQHYTVEHLPSYPKSSEADQYLDQDGRLNKIRRKRVEAEPLNVSEPHLEAMQFYNHFPNGRNYFNQTERPTPIRMQQYAKARLEHEDGRFREDISYLFFLAHCREMKSIQQGMYATMKTSGVSGMTRKQMDEHLLKGDSLLEANLTNLMAAVRGSDQYWNRVRGDLDAMDEAWGPATWFVTLSVAEYDWVELIDYLKRLNPERSHWSPARLCAQNPVIVSMYFNHRYSHFFNEVICAKPKREGDPYGALGEVEHWVWRCEYQARGAPHIHLKCWIKGAPIIGEDPDEEVLEFITKHITCELPNPAKNPQLHKLVNKYQTHRCSSSCLRSKNRGNVVKKQCRFGFPRSKCAEAKLRSLEKTVASRTKGKKVLKLYDLPRREEEKYINDYNPVLLLLWQANIDVQYIGEKSVVLNKYITNYMTKAEHSATAELWDSICSRGKSIGSNLMSFGLQLLGCRQVGANEASDFVLGHKLHQASEGVKYIPAQMPEKRKRKLKSPEQLANLGEDEQNLYCNNQIDTYYPNRPSALENTNLYEFSTCYDRSDAGDNKLKMRNNHGFVHRRVKPSVIKMPRFKPEGDTKEQYFYQLLLILKPWRLETELTCEGKTYAQTFTDWCAELEKEESQKLREQINKFKATHERYEEAVEASRRLIEEAENAEDEDEELADGDQEEEINSAEVLDELKSRVLTQAELQEKVDALNVEQRYFFDQIIGTLAAQKDNQDNNQQDSDGANKPIRLFLSGVGGSGKSFLIQTLVDQVVCDCVGASEDEEEKIVDKMAYAAVLAPTGVAAFNVNGYTLHRYFKLGVQKGQTTTPPYTPLDKEAVKVLREQLKDVQLIIIDEISMVSNAMLYMLHRRLEEVFGGSEKGISFGGKNIVVFGDLLQLKPVKSLYCFEELTTHQKTKVCQSMPALYNLFHEFQFGELKQNMRQKNDAEGFIDLLGRLRIGSSTMEDIQKLQARVIQLKRKTVTEDGRIRDAAKYYQDNLIQQNALCVLPKNDSADKFNNQMLRLEKIQTEQIPCIEMGIRNIDGKKQKGYKKRLSKEKAEKVSETGGLLGLLTIGKDARVMLRRNLDVSSGLVNGAMGTVKNIHKSKGVVSSIDVLFDGQKEIKKIERIQVDYEKWKGIMVSRKQFPLMLAYAISIHKCQGVSLNAVMADLGSGVFEQGMAYVALSRCRTLAGVHLIQLDPCILGCDSRAIDEYNRLLAVNGLEPMPPANDRPPQFAWSNRKKGRTTEPKSSTPLKRRADGETDSKGPAKKRQKTSSAAMPFVRLGNRHTDCFVISAVQGLFSLPGFMQQVSAHLTQQHNNICAELANLKNVEDSGFRDHPESCENIRTEVFGGYFEDGQQHDVIEYLDRLLDELPETLKDLFSFQEGIQTTCTACNHSETIMPNAKTGLLLNRTGVPKCLFSDLLLIENETLPCDSNICNGQHRSKSRRTVFNFPDGFQYLIVRIELFELDAMRQDYIRMPTKIRFNCRKERIGNINFETCAAICHTEGNTIKSGHYFCWRKYEDLWHKVDDDQIQTSQKKFIANLENVYALVLRRQN